jgi:hypothetical protein
MDDTEEARTEEAGLGAGLRRAGRGGSSGDQAAKKLVWAFVAYHGVGVLPTWAALLFLSSVGDCSLSLSAQPFSISKVSFLPITLVLQPLILSILSARTL